MHHQELEPPEELRDIVRDVWYISRNSDEQSPSFEVTPDGCAEIIFYFGSTCHVLTPDGLEPLSSPFLVGLLQHPILFQAQGRLEMIGIKCWPWAVFELLGLSAGAGPICRMEHPIAGLQAPLATWLQAGKVAEALAHVVQYLGSVRALITTDQLLQRAGTVLRAAGGTLPVGQVAAAAHATVRTLERKFKRAAGHTVKDVASLMRFEQACHRIWQQPTASLAGLAQELGYSDQSHLGREFKRYSGTTPAVFARNAARWQQAVSTDFVAFVLA